VNNRRAVALGSGSYLPKKVLSNEELSKTVDTTDEWIQARTGIKQRHIAAEDELTSDLATHAALRALEQAGVQANDLDLIVVATATPDQTFPSTATRVQHALGMNGGFAFDVQAVCSGFVYALSVATHVLFGDGAGAVVLQGQDGTGELADRGVLSTELRSDGEHNQLLYVDGGPSSTGDAGLLRMRGKEVFRHAVVNLATIGEEALHAAGAKSSDVDWVVPHQANHRIIEATARKVGIPMEQVILTVQDHGNTSAASIPLALDQGVRDGRITKGNLLLLEAMGGGFTWGAAALRW